MTDILARLESAPRSARRPERTFAVYTAGDGPPIAVRGVGETVDGGGVLPGFTLDVAAVFAEAEWPSGV